MDYNNGKIVGKIYNYDGEVGVIITSDDIYEFTKKDLNFDNVFKGQEVEFYSNIVPFGNDKYLFARDITTLNKKEDYFIQK